jgi:uncharacterized protein
MTRPSAAFQAHRERILELARAHGARNVRVFGSAARGADRESSDLDLLVEVDERDIKPSLPERLAAERAS